MTLAPRRTALLYTHVLGHAPLTIISTAHIPIRSSLSIRLTFQAVNNKLTFEVMHQHPLGWTNEGNKSTWRGGKGKEKWLYNQKMAEMDSDNSKGGGTEERREAGAQEILGGGTS